MRRTHFAKGVPSLKDLRKKSVGKATFYTLAIVWTGNFFLRKREKIQKSLSSSLSAYLWASKAPVYEDSRVAAIFMSIEFMWIDV